MGHSTLSFSGSDVSSPVPFLELQLGATGHDTIVGWTNPAAFGGDVAQTNGLDALIAAALSDTKDSAESAARALTNLVEYGRCPKA